MRLNRVSRGLFGNITMFVFLGLMATVMVIPMLYIINNAFKPLNELFMFPPQIFVQNPTGRNFTELFNLLSSSSVPFLRYLFNTLFMTTMGTVGQIILGSMCAYALSKLPFPGKKQVFGLIVTSLMFSGTVTGVPVYMIVTSLGMMDTYWAMFVPALQSTLGLYLMKQFMDSTIPDALLEAARIDGAGEGSAFFRIVMPLLKPAWLTLMILSIQNLWNSSSPYTFSETLKTMPQALSQISAGGLSRAGVGAAISLLMMAPPVLFFIISQSNILETMSTSGMKE